MKAAPRTSMERRKAGTTLSVAERRFARLAGKYALALRELKQSAEQQAASAEILRALSRSSADAQAVFDAIVEHAHRLCGAVFSILYRYDGRVMTVAADRVNAKASRILRSLYPAPPRKDHIVGRAILEGRIIHSADVPNDPRFPGNRNAFMKAVPFRAGLEVPLLRNGAVVGAIAVGRFEPKAFTKKEISLLETFADQAVIAIENVRLFEEVQARTRELSEALERQTATTEVLNVISRSTSQLQPVLDAIVKTALRLCQAEWAVIRKLGEDGEYHVVANEGAHADFIQYIDRNPIRPSRGSVACRTVLERRTIHVPDVLADPEYTWSEAQKIGRLRTVLGVPLMREGEPIGVITLNRSEVRPFTESQIELVTTFADQAVIAIENVRLFNETKEALEQQTATSEILRVISNSPTEIQPVLDAVAATAARLCEAKDAIIQLKEGDVLRFAAHYGTIPNLPQGGTRAISREMVTGRAVLEGRQIHVHDLQAEKKEFPQGSAVAKEFGYRTMLVTPLMREGKAIGTILIRRTEVRPFSDKHLALVRTFADQAVIAIENAKMFREIQERNAELKQSLDFQGASGEILASISSSVTDTKPVFDAIAENTRRLLDTNFAAVSLLRSDQLELVAAAGDETYLTQIRAAYPWQVDDVDGALASRAVRGREIVHVCPIHDDPDAPAKAKRVAKTAGYDSILIVPMLREGAAIGTIATARRQAVPFDDKQIALIKAFADQAVIAIENARLFNETKEALERQTATSEVLRVISQSQTDAQPVFDAIIHSAVRLCAGTYGHMTRVDGDMLHLWAHHGNSPEALEMLATRYPAPLSETSLIALAVRTRSLVHSPDTLNDPRASHKTYTKALNLRAQVSVPLIKGDTVIGVLNVQRDTPGPFSEEQLELLRTFADQAVIAIQNARLFNETKAALEQQKATADVLGVIAASPTKTHPVFEAIAASCVRLFGGKNVTVALAHGDKVELAAFATTEGVQAREKFEKLFPLPLDEGSVTGRAILGGKVVYVPDVEADPNLGERTKALARGMGYRNVLCAPMIREGMAIGTINVIRDASESVAYTEKQITLLKTFAAQAVIAIENVRLFNETKEALEQQTATAEILKVISGSPTDTEPVFQAIAERAGRICEASDARIFLVEGTQLRYVAGFGNVPSVEIGALRPMDRGLVMGRSVIDGKPVHVEDIQAVPDEFPTAMRQFGHRTVLSVPLMRENKALGAILLRRLEVHPFSEKQIVLLKTFADQAAIAIENVRLFNETKEALERQTATAEILKVISDSPTNVQPVFDAILARAAALCGASFGNVFTYDGSVLEMVAANLPSASMDILRREYPAPPSRDKVSGRVVLDRRIVEIADVEEDAEYGGSAPKASGHRSLLGVPLLREGQPIGAIVIARHEPGKFAPKQVAMVQTFADQAVIAIENVRLFKELQARTEALTKSVGQLTALGEVGHAISSTLDLEAVLKTIVARAVQLTGLDGGSIYEYDERSEVFTLQAAENMPEKMVEDVRKTPVRKGDGAIGRSAITLEPVQVADILDESYRGTRKELLVRAGVRAILAVPLLRENHLLGAILVNRKTPGPFAPEVVELLKTFATQSALAIQNARLFREIAEKGKQLEVASRHKSDFLASMSHELRTPLNALLGFNEMILGDIYGEVPGDMKPPLAQMQSSGKHLLRLINNVLDLAKIEAGRMELALSDYSVHDTVESVRSTLRPLAADKGLEFLAAVQEEIPLAYGDPGRITQCLMNLAGNSLKFTKAGKVEISAALNNGWLRYRVADTGIGIPSEKLGSLFTEFKQTDATIASEYGGTGLGLSISKKFVEMHGGRIWVESEVGKGSTFIFEIPLRAKTA